MGDAEWAVICVDTIDVFSLVVEGLIGSVKSRLGDAEWELIFVDTIGVFSLAAEGLIGSLMDTLGVSLAISPIFLDVPSNLCFNFK